MRLKQVLAVALLSGATGCASMSAHVDVTATPDEVWAIVNDVERYGEWNPFFVEGQGLAQEGSSLALKMQPPGQSPIEFAPAVLEVVPGNRLVWQGRLILPGIFDGTHRISIARIDETRVRVTQEEVFFGLLVPFVGFADFLAGWQQMNDALKRRAEARHFSTD